MQLLGDGSSTNVTATHQQSARKSGRLREKGPMTYTTNGEVFRGGRRVNEGKYMVGIVSGNYAVLRHIFSTLRDTQQHSMSE